MPFASKHLDLKPSRWLYVVFVVVALVCIFVEGGGFSAALGLFCPLILDIVVRKIAFPKKSAENAQIFYRLCCAEGCKWCLFALMLYILIHVADGFPLILGLIIGQFILIIHNFVWLKY
ncbi:MAG: hypothetical protein CMF41_01740 [Legionellales bacterium]|jgi:hypothetical protein|nr:hypothetical protein [Legionellales bacterium]OUX65963.1 MAG: hypothetical protein CBE41_00950 [Gammaproteobacteria bacterium TMED281]|tara:strand:+ start:111 stop:467 length:357 start_codon:yes stop_codon:yes gene_type:complete